MELNSEGGLEIRTCREIWVHMTDSELKDREWIGRVRFVWIIGIQLSQGNDGKITITSICGAFACYIWALYMCYYFVPPLNTVEEGAVVTVEGEGLSSITYP